MAAAENAGARVLLGFSHSRSRYKRVRKTLPSPRRFRKEFLRFRARYPFIKEYLTWNEANHRGQPTWNHPKLVGRYYDILRNNCRVVHDRRALGARLDQDARLGQAGREGRQAPHRHLGDPQLHRRQPLPHARHALAAARDQGEDLVHRDRRPGAARQRLDDRVRRVAQARGEGDEVGAQARPPEPARPARVLLPLDRARARRHLGLGADRTGAAARAPPTRSCARSCAGCGRRRASAPPRAPAGEAAGARPRARGRRRAGAGRVRQPRVDPRRRRDGRQDADGLLVAAEPGAAAARATSSTARSWRWPRRTARRATTRSTSPRSTRRGRAPASGCAGRRRRPASRWPTRRRRR